MRRGKVEADISALGSVIGHRPCIWGGGGRNTAFQPKKANINIFLLLTTKCSQEICLCGIVSSSDEGWNVLMAVDVF